MLQLAAHHRVVVVEEPLACEARDPVSGIVLTPRIDRVVRHPGLEVLVPRMPLPWPADADAGSDAVLADAALRVAAWLEAQSIDEVDVWLTSPRALPLLGPLRTRTIVYDCDRLCESGTARGPMLTPRQAALLDVADLVVTRSPGLQERLSRLHAESHWLPDAVDTQRFRPAGLGHDSEESRAVWQAQRHFAGPRFGYFGRIDSRLDFELLCALADRQPESQLVMVGPLEGLDESRLPRRANIHWLGAHPYAQMAHFAASWDACLLPYAKTAANRWLCPGQALEYLAAEKPVIATALPDVVRLFGNFVRVAASVDAFVLACADALAEDAAMQYERAVGARAMLSGMSWERAAGRARRLLERPGAGVTPAEPPSTPSIASRWAMAARP
jgi:glycosyltransferase involved in cell wall biosynthesis